MCGCGAELEQCTACGGLCCPDCGCEFPPDVEDDWWWEGAWCRICGCTDEAACDGGCTWAEDPQHLGDVCSRCVDVAALHPRQIVDVQVVGGIL